MQASTANSQQDETRHNKHVTVFVLGDVGKSPRMNYHALSLASIPGTHVDLVGLSGAQVHERVSENKNITLHRISDWSWRWMPRSPRLLFLLLAPLKVFLQSFLILLTLLFFVERPEYILVQNPPSIPSLFLVQLVCLIRGSKLVIDWHNFGYSILALSMRPDSFIVNFAKWIEFTFGKKAYAHFCVSSAMRQVLREQCGITATVVYDRPPDIFHHTTIEEKHELFKRIFSEYYDKDETTGEETTLFTVKTALTKRVVPSSISATTATATAETANTDEQPIEGKGKGKTVVFADATANTTDNNQQEFRHRVFGPNNVQYTYPSKQRVRAMSYERYETQDQEVSYREDRPVLIISSTSWTADEDFDIMLDAIKQCEQLAMQFEQEQWNSQQEIERNKRQQSIQRRLAAKEAAATATDTATEENTATNNKTAGADELDDEDSLDDDKRRALAAERFAKRYRFPKMLFVITGKGPLKEHYEAKISRMFFSKSSIRTMWLAAEDYPLLLSSSDLGICLHYSSSGVDLPMKIVDMFGCGLPVCAVYYRALRELVEHDKNGLVFSSSHELASQLFNLFKMFPYDTLQRDAMRANLSSFQNWRWNDEWNRKARPIFSSLSQ